MAMKVQGFGDGLEAPIKQALLIVSNEYSGLQNAILSHANEGKTALSISDFQRSVSKFKCCEPPRV